MPTIIVNGYPAETGCYVEGHWGQYGPDHLADQAEGFGWSPDKPTDDPRIIRVFADEMTDAGYGSDDATQSLWEWHSNAADEIETWLNERTPDGFVWHWFSGEFFLSPICDDEENCTDEECAHWDA